MQHSSTHRARWPWLLVMVVVVVAALAEIWWEPAPREAVVLAPRVPMLSNPAPAPEASRAPSTPTVPSAPPLKLVGTVMAGAGSLAMVRHASDSRLLELRVGDRVEDLVVTAITPDRVSFTGEAGPVVIEADRTVAASASPVPSAAVHPPAGAQAAPPAWAEGEAPWDLAPPFKH